MQKVMNTGLLNECAFDIVKDKVIQDQLKEAQVEDKKNNKKTESLVDQKDKKMKESEKEKDEFPELDEIDSEEERIMKKEMSRRQEMADKYIENEKEKAKRKYGYYKEIIETEFLDTMLKNDKVVCHFYHNSFERCKIMDKHLKHIAETHGDTLFVKINAEKTPFFTEKLGIQV
jgi:hypothetical protein